MSLLSACVPSLPSRSAGSAATPQSTGGLPANVDPNATLTLPGDEPRTLDPAVVSDAQSSNYLSEIYDGLVRFNADGVIAPALAERWDVSADGKRYTFHLRTDARFQDGASLTAEAFKFGIDRATDPALRSTTALTYLGDIQGVSERLAGKAPEVSGVKAIDAGTLELDIVQPRAYFLEKLTYPTAYPLDAASVRAGGADWWKHPNGSGPFSLASWVPQQQLTLERSERYAGGRPILAKLIFVFNTPLQQRLAAYQAAQVDMTPVPGVALPTVFADQSQFLPDLKVYDQPALTYLGFNARVPPFDDPAMRQAVVHGMDRAWIIHNALGSGAPLADSIIPPGVPGYDANVHAFPFNLDLAKSELARSRYAKSMPSIVLIDSISGGSATDFGKLVAAMLQQTLGLQIQVEPAQPGGDLTSLAAGKAPAQLYLAGWQADYPDAQDFVDLLFHTGRDTNYGGYSDPQVDRLLDEAATGTNEGERIQLYRNAETLLLRDAALAPIWFDRQYYLVKPYVGGVGRQAAGGFDFRAAYVLKH